MKKHYQKVSIVIPVYNEERSIKQILKKVIEANTHTFEKEVIVVDDASSDSTVKQLKSILKTYQSICGVRLIEKKENEGKGAAMKIGILRTSGDIVIVQDADCEYDPSEYPFLLEPFIKYGADVVYGSRFVTTKPRRVLYFWHYVANILLTFLSNVCTNLNLTDMETGYKAFKGNLIREIATTLQSKAFGFEPEVTACIARKKGIKIFEVGISYQGRTYEEGKKIRWTDGVKAVWEIIKYNLFSYSKKM